MKTFIKLLETLQVKDSLFADQKKVAFLLSGQSDLEHSELSLAQKDLLAAFSEYGYSIVEVGFPFNKRHDFKGCKRADMLLASYRNIVQFIYSTFLKSYRELIAKHLQPIFDCSREIVIICQSSGLHMLKTALPFIGFKKELKVTIVALGPVTMRRFCDNRFKLVVIKGYKDWVSLLFDRQPVDHWVSCNHFDYCQCKEVRETLGGVLENENKNRLYRSSL